MLELTRVEKRLGQVQALGGVSLKVERGQTTALLGASGSGKSTLLRVLTGLVWPDSGEMRFDGVVINRSNIQKFRQRMGYVIQEGGLFPHLTLRDNIALLARHLGRTHDWIDSRLDQMAELTRLPKNLFDRHPREVSGGQRQRAALARALFLDPEVLLLDEPLGALDPVTRSAMQEELRSLFLSLGKTVIMVTHDLAEAVFFSNDLILFDAGQIIQRGCLADWIEQPATPYVTQFVRSQRVAAERSWN